MKRQINIFIASPTDVNPERNIAKEVCRELDQAVGSNIEINSILWEDYPQHYQNDAQSNINTHLKPSECDIVIVILWKRLGTILPEGHIGKVTKGKRVTGTQWEFEEALAGGKPTIHLYLKTEAKSYSEDELEDALEQKKLLETFFDDINLVKGSARHGYHEFETSDDFKQRLKNHLKVEVEGLTGRKILFSQPFVEHKYTEKSSHPKLLYTVAFLFIASLLTMNFDKIFESLLKSEKTESTPLQQETVKKATSEKKAKKQEIKTTLKSDETAEKKVALDISIEYADMKKYLKVDSEKMRVSSINPYYLHYKTIHPHSFNFAMAQWADLSVMSMELKEKFSVEKKGYQAYLKQELKTANERLSRVDQLEGTNLENLFYVYANSGDMTAGLNTVQMRERLKKYIRYSLEQLKETFTMIKSLNAKERLAVKVSFLNSSEQDIVIKNSAYLVYEGKQYMIRRIQEPLSLSVLEKQKTPNIFSDKQSVDILEKGVTKMMWFAVDGVDILCVGSKSYQLSLLTKSDRFIKKHIECKR